MRGLLRFFAGLIATGAIIYGFIKQDDVLWLVCLLVVFLCLLVIINTSKAIRLQKIKFNRSVQRLAGVLLSLFLVASLHLLYLQVIEAKTLNTKPQHDANGVIITNPRTYQRLESTQRGDIYDRNGTLLATSKQTQNGFYIRQYTQPSTSYLIGYHSDRFGDTNLEDTYGDYLSGTRGTNPLDIAQNQLFHRKIVGNDLYLTIDLNLQKVAQNYFNSGNGTRPYKGALIALNPQTGEILAMVSSPVYDPNQLVTNWDAPDAAAESKRVQDYWDTLTKDPNGTRPLLMRATQGLYPPGSTFKTVTAIAGIDSGLIQPTTVYTDVNGTGRITGNNESDTIYDCPTCLKYCVAPSGIANYPLLPPPHFTLTDGYRCSLNVVFAQAGVQAGADNLSKYSHLLDIGQPIDNFDLPLSQSSLANDELNLTHIPVLAETSFGQGELQVTPLNMALVAASVANGGHLPQPYLVQQIKTKDGSILKTNQPGSIRDVMNGSTDQQIRQMMIISAHTYAGPKAGTKLPADLKIGAKTGTAEVTVNGQILDHSWFICYAGHGDNPPDIAIAVVGELEGEGTGVALGGAYNVLQTYYQTH